MRVLILIVYEKYQTCGWYNAGFLTSNSAQMIHYYPVLGKNFDALKYFGHQKLAVGLTMKLVLTWLAIKQYLGVVLYNTATKNGSVWYNFVAEGVTMLRKTFRACGKFVCSSQGSSTTTIARKLPIFAWVIKQRGDINVIRRHYHKYHGLLASSVWLHAVERDMFLPVLMWIQTGNSVNVHDGHLGVTKAPAGKIGHFVPFQKQVTIICYSDPSKKGLICVVI